MSHTERQRLKVAEAAKEDVYKDIVRIHWRERGKRNHIGAIVSISVDGGRRRFLSLRGLPEEHRGEIRMDHVTRAELHLQLGETHEFAIRETNAWQKLVWAVRATDPAARIAAWIAVWSVIIAVLGLIFATWPIIHEWRSSGKAHTNAVQSSTR
jgi:hypothetical protein